MHDKGVDWRTLSKKNRGVRCGRGGPSTDVLQPQPASLEQDAWGWGWGGLAGWLASHDASKRNKGKHPENKEQAAAFQCGRPLCAPLPVRSLPLGAHPALRPRPPPLPWLAWVASPHHHAPGGREVDGALSRPSPKRNGAPNTCPDYCAFPGCSLSVREGSVRVVTPWNTRTPAPSPSLGSITSATTGSGQDS